MLRWLPENVSTFGSDIDSLFYLIYYITGAVFILVPVASMGWQGVKSDRKQTTTVVQQVLAADFTLPSTTGGTITLSDFRGKSNVLLYFMEGVGCDPCFQQSRDIQNEYDKFKAMDMQMGKPGSVMHVPVKKLMADLKKGKK